MKLSHFLTGIAFTLSAVCAQAQQFTVPEGVMSYTFTPGTTTYASFPLTADPAYGDAVSSVTANTITVTNSSAFTGTLVSLTTAGSPYFVVFTSGAQAGRVLMVTANTATTLTLDTTNGGNGSPEPLTGNADAVGSAQGTTPSTPLFNVAQNDTFELYPGETLAGIFGSANAPTGILTGNTTLKTADYVTFPKSNIAPSKVFFFNTTYNYWVRNDDTANPPVNVNNLVIPPFSSVAVFVQHTHPSASLVLQGRVADTPLLIKSVAKAQSYAANPYATDTTLGELGLTFGPNFTTSNTFHFADNVGVYNSQETPPGFDTYYEDASSIWHRYPDTSTSYNNLSIPAGSVITINQHTAVAGATSFLPSALPYDLNQ